VGLRFAYNTNGLAHHRLDDALDLLADTGYDGVALTLDHGHLDPYAPGAGAEARRVAERLGDLGLGCVVETGARFLLDPRAKHEPTLVTADPAGRARRGEFLRRCVEVAAVLEAEAVSFWAGVPAPGVGRERAWEWLVEGVAALVPVAREHGVDLAFEPEPGMLVEHVEDWRRLAAAVPGLGLALDTGHCVVAGGLEPEDAVRATAPDLRAVAVEGMRRGVHEHLPLDVGDVDVPAVLAALAEVGYDHLVSVELSRDAHRADVMVPRALELLRAAERAPSGSATTGAAR
jgi:sugar phosphate isomerase/epimerase